MRLKCWMMVASIACSCAVLPAQQTMAGHTPPPATKDTRYLPGVTLDYTALLPEPPAPGSPAGRADLAAVHRAERERTPEQIKAAQQDDVLENMFAFATVLGPKFNAADLPLTAAFSVHVRAQSAVVNPTLKLAFGRPRPFVEDPTLHPVCARTPSSSYPSGHAMVGYLEGLTLAQMVPEKKAQILARAREYAENRIVCGVHNPSDIEASHTVALALFGALSTSAAFQAEMAAARAEVRKALGMP